MSRYFDFSVSPELRTIQVTYNSVRYTSNEDLLSSVLYGGDTQTDFTQRYRKDDDEIRHSNNDANILALPSNAVSTAGGAVFDGLDLSDKKEVLVLFAQRIRNNNINERMTTGNRLSKIIERFRDSVISGFFGQGDEASFPKGMTFSEDVDGTAFNRRIKTSDVGAKNLFLVDDNENLSLGADIALQQSNHPADTIPNTALQNGIPFTKIDGDIPATRIAGQLSESNLGINSNLLMKWTHLMGFPVILTRFTPSPSSRTNGGTLTTQLSEVYTNFNYLNIKIYLPRETGRDFGYYSKIYPTEDFVNISTVYQGFLHAGREDADTAPQVAVRVTSQQVSIRTRNFEAGFVGVWGIGRKSGDYTQDELDILA